MDEKRLNPAEFRKQVFRRFKDKGVPLEGIFEITGRCNFNCKMCYVHTMPNAHFQKKEKNGDWWIAQIDEACNAGMLFALLTGGECLLHPEFKRIYSHLRSRGVYTRINTNGSLLTDDMIAFLQKDPPFEIQMTLYGTSDESYEAVTGSRAFASVETAIDRLINSGLYFKIAVTPNPFAKGETERIIAYLKEREIPFAVNQGLFTPYSEGSAQTVSENDLSIDEKVQILKAASRKALEPIPADKLPPIGGGRTEPSYGTKCSGGRLSFFITWDGYMQMCNAFYFRHVPVCTAEDFLPAWQEIQNVGKSFLMPIECEGCAYKKACLVCPVLRSGKVGNGHCDPAVCELTRKLVAAGVKKLDQMPESCED